MKQDFKNDLKIEKNKKPYVLVVLIILLICASIFAGYNAYRYSTAKTPNEKIIEKVKDSGYLSVETELEKDAPKDLKEFIKANKNKKGSYILNKGKYTYIMISSGKTDKDGKNYTISIDAPSYNKDKTKATIVYRFVPFTNDVKDVKSNYVLLKLEKTEIQMIESANELVL